MTPFEKAVIREIERLEKRITKLGVILLEEGGEGRQWALDHPVAENYRNRIKRGELVEVGEP